MDSQLFTFGCGQNFANTYVRITAVNADVCRRAMHSLFGERWSMQYPDTMSTVDNFSRCGMSLFCEVFVDCSGMMHIDVKKTELVGYMQDERE